MDHIDWARWAELLVVAPCSADLLARLALGLAGDLPSTIALALEPSVPRLLCPAMNPVMWQAAPIQRHVATLHGDGWRLMEPPAGHMACGEAGQGRLAEPADIVEALGALLP